MGYNFFLWSLRERKVKLVEKSHMNQWRTPHKLFNKKERKSFFNYLNCIDRTRFVANSLVNHCQIRKFPQWVTWHCYCQLACSILLFTKPNASFWVSIHSPLYRTIQHHFLKLDKDDSSTSSLQPQI